MLGVLFVLSVAAFGNALKAAELPDEQSWTTNAPIPEVRGVDQGVALASRDGSLIYYVGGSCCSRYANAIDRVWAYSPDSDSWSSKANIPVVTGIDSLGAAAELNGFIYVFGGFTGPALALSILNTTWIYDETNDVWFQGANMPDYRAGSAVATDGTVIWVIGGYDGSITSDLTNTVWMYEPRTDTYQTDFVPMPIHGARIHSVELPDGTVHVLTGRSGPNLHLVYDTLSDAWSNAPAMPVSVLDPSVVTDGNLIYVAGGSGPVPRPPGWTQIYDPATFTWSQGPRMPAPAIDNTSGTIAGGVFYVIGGYDGVAPGMFNYSLLLFK